jgi:hypothetical protein
VTPQAPRTLLCGRHPGVRAGWTCVDCRRGLCPECVAIRRMQRVELLVCRLCQGRAELLRQHRSQRSFPPLLAGIGGYPLKGGNAGVLAGMVLWLVVLKSAPMVLLWGTRRFEALWAMMPVSLLLWIFSAGCVLALCFTVIQTTAAGRDDLEQPELGQLGRDVVRPVLWALAGNVWLWVPLARSMWGSGGFVGTASQVALALGLALYVPWVLLLCAAGASFTQVANPLVVLGSAWRLREQGRYIVGLSLLLAGPIVLFQAWGFALWSSVPVLGAVLGEALALYLPVVLSRALGLLLFVRGDSLGYGTPDDFLEPLLPGAQPRHVLPS